MKFTVACVQLNSQNNLQYNIDQASDLIRSAAKAGANFIALPENAGFMGANAEELLANVFYTEEHPTQIAFAKLAKQLGVWILIGSLAVKVKGEEKIANRSVLLNDCGNISEIYDKIHLYNASVKGGESHRESDRYLSGDKAVIAKTPWCDVGLTICYDLRFPYLFRLLAKSGAKVVVVPSAFTKYTGKMHWHVLLRARAIENSCYIIAPAQTGEHPAGRETFGNSLMIDPWGEIISDCKSEVGFCVAELDLQKVDEVRTQMQSLQHDIDLF